MVRVGSVMVVAVATGLSWGVQTRQSAAVTIQSVALQLSSGCCTGGAVQATLIANRSSEVRRVLGSAGMPAEVADLSDLLATIVQQQLTECSLVLIHDGSKLYSSVVETLLHLLPNPRQVVVVLSEDDLGVVEWVWPRCSGYLVLLVRPAPLLAWTHTHQHDWNYAARFVVACEALQHVEALASSTAGINTEHILGVIKGERAGEWRVYMNMQYWGVGIRWVTTWLHGWPASQTHLFPDKMADLRGTELKVSTFKFEPSVMYYYEEDGSLAFRYGVDISLVKALGYALNFTPRFLEPSDGETWSRVFSNGSWTGTFGALQRGEADIVVSNLFMSDTRKQYVDFTEPYKIDMTCFMTRTEPPLPRWHALAFPFHPWTWLAILVGFIVSGPVLYCVAFTSGRWGEEVHSLSHLGFSVFYALGLHTCETFVQLPRRSSTRVFVIFLWLYTMVLTISYSTNLTAFLLVRKQPTSMQTIEDIYNSGLDVISMTDVFRAGIASSTNPYLKRLLPVHKVNTSTNDIFSRVLGGKAVYLQNRHTLEFQTSTCYTWRGVQRVRILRECYKTFNVAMAMRLHTPLKRKFDEVIAMLQQSGLLEHYFMDSLRVAASDKNSRTCDNEARGKNNAEEQEESDVIPLRLEHLQGLFFILCIGWAVSVIGFTVEMLIINIWHL